MMADPRTEYAQVPRRNGLIFQWRVRRSPPLAKLGILTVAAAVFLIPLVAVRIRVGAPPVQDAQSAAMMVLTPDHDPMHWIEAARELGPFPTRFDPTGWPQSQVLVGEVLGAVRGSTVPPHEPRYQELPEESPPPPVPLIAKGSRVFPSIAPPEFTNLDAVRVRPLPVLYPLSTGAGELPDTHPPFDTAVTPEMAFQPWRFLLQIAPDGAVLHATALIGHNTPGRADLTRWLESHRFPAHDGPADRWVAVAVTFQNHPTDGTDDP